MKKIVIIGANNFQMPLIKKAKQLGYETHVFAWADGAVGAEFADYFYPISIIEKEKILEKCKEIKPDAITSVALYFSVSSSAIFVNLEVSVLPSIIVLTSSKSIENLLLYISSTVGTDFFTILLLVTFLICFKKPNSLGEIML